MNNKHISLLTFKNLRDEYEKINHKVKTNFSIIRNACSNLCDEQLDIVRVSEINIFICSNTLPELIDKANEILDNKIQDISDLSNVMKANDSLVELLEIVRIVEIVAETKIEKLSKDIAVKTLAQDYDKVKALYTGYSRYVLLKVKKEKYELAVSSIDKICIKYVDWMQAKMMSAFDIISSDVMIYFNELEKTASHISEHTIKLNTDKNKAVELEIKFNSEVISPVYKYLSESQINSFGMAIFLAAIKNFNSNFKFIILDDVINSFDAFKRPRIIELLQVHFKDYQFLILTHDTIWYERLLKGFQNWNKLRFESWNLNHGPKVALGKSSSEQIDEYLKSDNGVLAGQLLGRYLEFSMQDYNYNLEGMLKYKPDNQYVLNELLDAMLARVSKDLKTKHILYEKLKNFAEDSMFRNYCAHYKSPEIEFTSEEIDIIFKKWSEIESIIRCEVCSTFVRKSGDDIYCQCRILNMKDTKYISVE